MTTVKDKIEHLSDLLSAVLDDTSVELLIE